MKPRITVATVAENREPYMTEVYWLFHSLRNFGGELSDTRCIAYFIDQAPHDVSQYTNLDIEIKLVNTIEPRFPHCNKIHMLLDKNHDCDWLITLDTDIIVTGDISPYLSGSTVCAKIVDKNRITDKNWETIFNYFDLPIPSVRFLTHFHAKNTIPYFNSGNIFIPGKYINQLGNTWRDLIPGVIEIYKANPDIAKHSFFTDQIAFAIALVKLELPFQSLPLALNFPTHNSIHPLFYPEDVTPLILHHHHKKDSNDRIAYCEYPKVNNLIDQFFRTIPIPNDHA